MDDGSVQLCSRSIACIYYLTKDWSENDGGQLLDLEAPGGPQVGLQSAVIVISSHVTVASTLSPDVSGFRTLCHTVCSLQTGARLLPNFSCTLALSLLKLPDDHSMLQAYCVTI